MQRNELILAAALGVLVLSGAVFQFYLGAGKTAEIVVTHSQRIPFENAAIIPKSAAAPTPAPLAIAGDDARLFHFLNSADLKQFMAVSGIGEKLAGQIVAQRNEIGRFSSIDQILAVEGVGDAKLEAMRRHVLRAGSAAPTPIITPSFVLPPVYGRPIFAPAPALQTPVSSREPRRPLSLNQASIADLAAVSGIGESLAQSIVNARQTAKGFKSWKDVDAIPGIGEQRLKLLQQYFYLPNDRK
ncbi:MAG: helix-hairpin-helix domain-containing protein [Candidatus Omnitrophota bacterium]